MVEITITPFVRNKLDELVLTLYNEGYFAFMESSEKYVKDIYRFLYAVPSFNITQQKQRNMARGIADTNQTAKHPGTPLLIRKMIFI